MGLLFQARTSLSPAGESHPGERPAPVVRNAAILLDAISVHLAGDPRRFAELFTDDVVCSAPHAYLRSRAEMEAVFGGAEEALSKRQVVLRSVATAGDDVAAEWELSAVLSGPVLLDDDLLVEPTGDAVHMCGATVATFRGGQICSIRHYFDDSELLDHIRDVGRLGRWLTRRVDLDT
jgi:hypothetical protein